MQVQLPTGALVTPSSYYPLDWNVQQAIAEVYNWKDLLGFHVFQFFVQV